MIMIMGTDLTCHDQNIALARYIYRFTGDHQPEWARKERKDGLPYPLQFASDAEWLANTTFPVTKHLRLAKRGHCLSNPTWPNNPELRVRGN